MANPLRISRKRHALWASGYQGVALVLNLIRGIILVPLYLKYIPLPEFGFWIVLRSTTGWLFVVNPGFAELVRARTARYLGAGTPDRIWNDGLLTLLFSGILGAIILLAAFVASFFLPQILGINDVSLVPRLTHAFFILTGGMILMLFAYVGAAVNDGMQQGAQTGAALTIANLVSIVASIAWLLQGWGIYALALSYVVLPIVYMAITSTFVWRNLRRLGARFPSRLEDGRSFWKEGLVNFRGRFSSLIANSSDRWLVGRILGPEAVVSYDLLKRVPETCFAMMGQFPHSLAPTLSHLAGNGNREMLALWGTRILTFLTVGCLSLAALILCVNQDFIGLWVGSRFYPSFQVDAPLVLWITFASLLNSSAVLLVSVKEVRSSAKILMSYSGLLLPVLLIGIVTGQLPGFTLAGALCAMGCVLIKVRPKISRAYAMEPFQIKILGASALTTILAGGGVVLAFRSFSAETWPLLIGKCAIVSLVLGGVILTLNPFVRQEVAGAICSMVKKFQIRTAE